MVFFVFLFVQHRVLGCLKVCFLEELHRKCDFQVRRLLEERLVADLNGQTAHLVVERNMLAENLAKLPGLALGTTLDALLIKERHGVHQPLGLFFSRLRVDTDILCAERAALTLHRVPDGVALVAGYKRAVDSFLGSLDGLDSRHACGSWRLLVGFSLRVQTLSIFILDYEHQISIVSRTNKKQGVSLFFIFFSYFQVFRDFEVLIVYLRKNSEVGNPHS